MLVLTRQPSEAIIATTPSGEIIRFTVCKVSGDKVRVGVEAAADVRVNREEIERQIKQAETTNE